MAKMPPVELSRMVVFVLVLLPKMQVEAMGTNAKTVAIVDVWSIPVRIIWIMVIRIVIAMIIAIGVPSMIEVNPKSRLLYGNLRCLNPRGIKKQ